MYVSRDITVAITLPKFYGAEQWFLDFQRVSFDDQNVLLCKIFLTSSYGVCYPSSVFKNILKIREIKHETD
jgi:hypothetical protein